MPLFQDILQECGHVFNGSRFATPHADESKMGSRGSMGASTKGGSSRHPSRAVTPLEPIEQDVFEFGSDGGPARPNSKATFLEEDEDKMKGTMGYEAHHPWCHYPPSLDAYFKDPVPLSTKVPSRLS